MIKRNKNLLTVLILLLFSFLFLIVPANSQEKKLDEFRSRVKDSSEKIKRQQQDAEATLHQAAIAQRQNANLGGLADSQRAKDVFRDMQERNRQMQQQQQQMLRDRLRDLRK